MLFELILKKIYKMLNYLDNTFYMTKSFPRCHYQDNKKEAQYKNFTLPAIFLIPWNFGPPQISKIFYPHMECHFLFCRMVFSVQLTYSTAQYHSPFKLLTTKWNIKKKQKWEGYDDLLRQKLNHKHICRVNLSPFHV